MRREILPDRPLRLSRRYRNNRLAVILIFGIPAVLFAIAFSVMGIVEVRSYDREQAIWDRGLTCDGGSYRATYDATTELEITCVAQDGAEHRGTLTLHHMSIADATAGDVEVRYDAKSPDEFAVSTGIAKMAQRRAATRGGLVGTVVLTFVLGGLALLFWRRLAIAQRLARSGDEVSVDVLRVHTKMRGNNVSHMRRVIWKYDGKLRKTWLSATHGLAWINSHEPKALAMTSGKHVMLLAGNFQPLDFDSEADRQQATARLERDGGGLPRGLEELADWIVISPPKKSVER